MTWKILSVLGVLVMAGAAGATWAFDIEQRIASNTIARLLQDFERLSAARQTRKLTQVEWIRWCQAGLYLQIFKTCPRR